MTMLVQRMTRGTLSTSRQLSSLGRGLQTASTPPHAYLRPLVPSKADGPPEELEGVQCLVMDREQARNALSVRMVNVSVPIYELCPALALD